jgi:hypothetical protein
MQLAAPIFYLILTTVIVYRWRFFHFLEINRFWTVGAYLIKMLACFLFFFIYTKYYQNTSESDALRYFDDAMTIRNQLTENPDVFWSFMTGRDMDHPEYMRIYNQLMAWTSGYRYGLSNDCSTIIRLNVLLSFISFKSFHVHAILLSFLAFIGFAAIFKTVASYFSDQRKIIFIACFLLPSVVFWSSSVLKEAPLFLGLGMLFMSLKGFVDNPQKIKNYLIGALSIALLFYVKSYVIFSLIPALLFLLIIKTIGQKRALLKFALVHIVCFICAQNAHYFFQGGDFIYVLHKKQVDFYNVAFLDNAKSVVDIPPITNTSNFLLHYPQTLFYTYFRPHLFEVKSWAYVFFAAENAGYLLMFILACIFFKRPKDNQAIITLAMVSYLFVLASIIGNCVPILGALVRYKIVGLPFLVIVFVAVFNHEKFIRVWRRFVKTKPAVSD